MALSIVMPVYQNLELNRKSVENLLLTDVPFELIVIDNGSTDGTAEFLATQPVKVISNPQNVGIAPAIDQGVAVAENEYLGVVCNDMVVHPSTFGRMLRAFEDPNVWCVTPMFTDLEMPSDWWRRADELAKQPVEYRKIGPPMPPMPQIDQMMGGCFAMSRVGWEAIGGFDPDLPDWYGDPAIWCRFRQIGHPVVQVNALIHHYQSMTMAIPGIVTANSFHAQAVFESKWGAVQDVIDDYYSSL